MHILVVEALLIAVYLRRKDVYMYIRPTLLPEAALPPKATLLPGASLLQRIAGMIKGLLMFCLSYKGGKRELLILHQGHAAAYTP
jgi:hypothetical protein